MPDLRQQGQQAAQAQATDDQKAYAESVLAQIRASQNPDGTMKVDEMSQPDHLRWARYAGLLGGGAADAISTRIALQNPNVREGNELLGGIANSNIGLAAFKLGTNAGIGLLLDKVAKENPKLANILAGVLAAGQFGLAAHNMKNAKAGK